MDDFLKTVQDAKGNDFVIAEETDLMFTLRSMLDITEKLQLSHLQRK